MLCGRHCTSFSAAVGKKNVNSAANAASAAVPSDPVKTGASISLSASGVLAKNLSTQLKAVVAAVTPCYDAEDNVFAIQEVLYGKATLDPDDKTLLKNWWDAADKNITAIVAEAKNQFAELENEGSINAFKAIVKFTKSADHTRLDNWLKNPGNAAPEQVKKAANNLWGWLNTATIAGVTTITEIAGGLDKISQSAPVPPAKQPPAGGG